VAWSSLIGASDYCLNAVRNGYGHGRSWIDFITHFWLVAVPSQGVNNQFDYPLGLSYLIVLGPFIWFMLQSLKDRRIAILPWLVFIFWLSWFAGSQQSRWLYIPILLMYLSVSVQMIKPSKILFGVLTVALILNVISLGRAHSADFKRPRQSLLREKDKALLEWSIRYMHEKGSGYVLLEDHEVAFARFPVMIRKESLPNVLAF